MKRIIMALMLAMVLTLAIGTVASAAAPGYQSICNHVKKHIPSQNMVRIHIPCD